jgi:regulator of RNase E activity RraA
MFTLTKEQMIKYTAQNPYERFPDGRPKVPDSILEKVKGLSAEEVGLSRSGFTNQFSPVSEGWTLNRPGQTLVGRAFTLKLAPSRPDVAEVDAADRQAKGLGRMNHQTALDMLQPGDVFVVEAFGNDFGGGIVGDNLAYYVWRTTGAGFVIDGAIRDYQGIGTFDTPSYFKAAVPPAIRNVMVAGINVPVRIGNVTVMPGDVVFGDREGIYFIPPHLVKEIVDAADITHIHDEWTRMKFDERKYRSTEIYGSPRDPALIKEYEDFLRQKLGPERYAEYQKSRSQAGAAGRGATGRGAAGRGAPGRGGPPQ